MIRSLLNSEIPTLRILWSVIDSVMIQLKFH